MGNPAILLFEGRGVVSSLIRLQTRGKYAHAALLRPDGRIYEAWQGEGVRLTTLKSYNGVDRYAVPGMTNEQWNKVFEFCNLQLGKGYDYWAIIRFISRRNMPDNDKYFCSELAFDAMVYAGVQLFERIYGWSVSPSLLSISPRITPFTESEEPEPQ